MLTIFEDDIKNKIICAKARDKEALEELIRKFTPLVIKTTRGIFIRGLELEDLISIGQATIIKAVNMYDIHRGKGFTKYVMNAIKNNYYYLIRQNTKAAYCCSLNNINEEGYELIESIPSEENFGEQLEVEEDKVLLKKAIEKLSEKDRELIYWYYFKNKTLEQYAREQGISYRAAAERKRKALEKLGKSFRNI